MQNIKLCSSFNRLLVIIKAVFSRIRLLLSFKKFRSAQNGVAGIEAAIILPIMIFFIFATIELYEYYRVKAIMDRAVFSLADGVAMQTELYEGGPCNQPDHICTYGVIAKDLMQPADYANKGSVQISLFEARQTGTSSNPKYEWKAAPNWSKLCNGSGTCTNTNSYPQLNSNDLKANRDDTVVVVQLRQRYEPFVISSKFWENLGGEVNLITTAYYRPRFDDLKNLQ